MSEPVTLWRDQYGWLPSRFSGASEAWKALPAAEFATLTRDLASARTALAEAKGVMARFSAIDVPDGCEPGTWVATTKYGNRQVTAHDVRMARDAVARIDALAGEGGGVSRHEALVARIEARVARRRSKASAPKRRSVVKAHPVKHRRGLLRLNAEVRALPPDVRAAYETASPAVRLLIREQARDDATVAVKSGPDFDAVLAWKAGVA